MGIRDRLDERARAEAERRRREIERLLAENPGRLTRGCGDALPGLRTHAAPRDLVRLMDESELLDTPQGRVRRWVTRVPVAPDPEAPPHPRGYLFLPRPRAGGCTPGFLGDACAVLGIDTPPRTPPAPADLLFLDTETTGMLGATGTVAFLVGLGWFECAADAGPDHFVVEQLFIEDFCDERALLALVADRIARHAALVTYNGRGYDMPLLEARFVMNRMRPPSPLPHLDLLHAARAVFRGTLESCSLRSVERGALGITRTHDVDGGLIPMIFFDYARGTRRERMVPVIDHNVQDIVSLGALLLDLGERTADDAHPRLDDRPVVAAAIGRLLRRRGLEDRATRFFERAVRDSRDPNLTRSALAELARLYRRAGRHDDAAAIWEGEWRRHGLREPQACLELIKVFERGMRRPDRALAVVADAERQARLASDLGRIGGGGRDPDTDDLLRELAKRRERLERRMASRKPVKD